VDSSLITIVANLGTGGVVIVLIILGYLVPKPAYTRLLEENDKLKDALELERQRSDDATKAGEVTNQLIGGLVRLAEHRHAEVTGTPSGDGLDLTGKDLGL
jgi:hypothetical protein